MDISIIICTYNPSPRVFQRCLNAIRRFDRTGLNAEVILVDNNSSPAIEEFDYVKSFLENTENSFLIRENKPGLIYARMAGFKKSQSPVIIYFDDDNEPAADYLITVKEILDKNKQVGMLGPGIINVEFLDGTNKWLETKRKLFQQREMKEAAYGNETDWYKDYYPFGTGIILKREVLTGFNSVVENQNEVSGRIGNSLLSGEDAQIVWTGIKLGFHAGSSPLLKLNHLIPSSRTDEKYIQKLHYSLSFSGLKSTLGVFPERSEILKKQRPTFTFFIIGLSKCIVKNIFDHRAMKIESVPAFTGKVAGYFYAFDSKKPWWLKLTQKIFKVDFH